MHRIYCEFAVITHAVNCEIVTKKLDLMPTRFFNKGDQVMSAHTSRTILRPHGLWAIRSSPVVDKELDLSFHIDYFKNLLGDKKEVINSLKHDYNFECVFAIEVETEDAGIGFDLSDRELLFIKDVSSRFSCHFMVREKI